MSKNKTMALIYARLRGDFLQTRPDIRLDIIEGGYCLRCRNKSMAIAIPMPQQAAMIDRTTIEENWSLKAMSPPMIRARETIIMTFFIM